MYLPVLHLGHIFLFNKSLAPSLFSIFACSSERPAIIKAEYRAITNTTIAVPMIKPKSKFKNYCSFPYAIKLPQGKSLRQFINNLFHQGYSVIYYSSEDVSLLPEDVVVPDA